ncbi:trigger factor [Segetibacter sp. 3557_3]|uniref:trigger factor n=1 Tax=Segetibacter sp. 3557_3 TaxID=2547429 RepID=UPI001058AAA0|nr:trigger factor [Segetibacter sp. 3557_3]TDH19823.1 trigger factor [Segetibacter sp. 3557_3]
MATVSRENIGLLNDKITVTLTRDDYFPAFEKQLKDYAKKANIPGFRKGMVPTGMIKKMYGSGVFTEEVFKSVEKELNEYMGKEQLEIFAQPLPLDSDARQLDMNNPADYTFAFEIGLKPQIDLNPANIHVTRHKVAITDEMINAEITQLETRHGKMTEPETVESEENVLNLDFSEVDAEGNIIEEGIKKGSPLQVKYFAEAFRPNLMGKKVGDSVTLKLSEAFEEKEREWLTGDLGIDASSPESADKTFKVTIAKIGNVEKPERNEDFYEAVFPGRGVKTEEEFTDAVRQEIAFRYDMQSRNQLHDQIYHQLIDNTPIELPESFLKRWIQNGGEKPKTAEEAESEYPAFTNSLKWTLISNQLMNQHELKVEPDEIKDFAKQQLIGYLGPQAAQDAPWLDSYAESMLKDKKFIENTYYQLQTTKLFEVLEGQVSIDEKEVSAAELEAMQHHHEH